MAKPLTKSEILASISATTELSRKQVSSVLDALGPAEAPKVTEILRHQPGMQLIQTIKAAPGLRQVKLSGCLKQDDSRLNVVAAGPKGWEGAQDFVLIGIQGDQAQNPAVRSRTLDLVRKTNIEAVGSEVFAIEPELD